MVDSRLFYINGKWTAPDSPRTLDVENPATEQVIDTRSIRGDPRRNEIGAIEAVELVGEKRLEPEFEKVNQDHAPEREGEFRFLRRSVRESGQDQPRTVRASGSGRDVV